MTILYSEGALNNLNEIAAYGYEHWGRARSKEFVAKLQDEVEVLQSFPDLGLQIKGVESVNGYLVRQLTFGNYEILYAISGNDIYVTSIVPKGRPQK